MSPHIRILPPEIIDWLHKKELEEYRAFNSSRYELRAHINGSPNGYAPISEAELKAKRAENVARFLLG